MLIAMTGTDVLSLKRGRRFRTFIWLDEACQRFQIDLCIANPAQLLSRKNHHFNLHSYPEKQIKKLTKEFLVRKAIVYDAMYLPELKMFRYEHKKALQQLKKLSIPVFNPILPNKADVFTYIGGHIPRGRSWIPETQFQVNVPQVMNMLKSGGKVWIKPVFGSGGRNMLQVQRVDGNEYQVIGDRFYGNCVNGVFNENKLTELLRIAFRKKPYFAQRHINLTHTRDGRPVDFRATVQRDESGDWRAISVTARTGKPGASVTNFHAGGSVLSLTRPTERAHNLLSELAMDYKDVKLIEKVAIATANILQQRFHLLGVLGIDVGRSVTGEYYVYDCNSRPGRDILTDEEIHSSMNCIAGYTRYLIDKKQMVHNNKRVGLIRE